MLRQRRARVSRFDVLTLGRHNASLVIVTGSRRSTIYLDADLHRALRVKAAETDDTVSDLVNAAVRRSLGEDAEDLAAFDDRAAEPSLDFATVLKDLKRRGKV